MELVVKPGGQAHCVYGELIDLRQLGGMAIRRASHVEPVADGGWCADLSPVGGPILGPFSNRSQALEAEQAWLQAHWLPSV